MVLMNLATTLAAGLACAQSEQLVSPQREFDVVSIKQYVPSAGSKELCNPRGNAGMLTRTGCTLEQLVREAYDLKPYQVRLKGPAWIGSDRWVMQARLAQPATRAATIPQPALRSSPLFPISSA
jgi:hypothetical protein